jgi:hypothetical protein
LWGSVTLRNKTLLLATINHFQVTLFVSEPLAYENPSEYSALS